MTTIIRRKIPYYPVFRSFHTENDNDHRKNIAPLNIIENNNVYRIELNVAGWKKEDIEIKLSDDTLTISGENLTKETKEDQYRVKEFSNLRFHRSMILSDAIDQNSIHAEMKDGILYIEMKKVEEEELNVSRKIDIE